MPDRETSFSGSPAQYGLRAFAAAAAERDDRREGVAVVGWREPFGELWCQLALANPLRPARQGSELAAAAQRRLAYAEHQLLASQGEPKPSPRVRLRSAALALECSARLWHAFGPAAGERRMDLLRRLEATLAETQQEIDAAELPARVSRVTIAKAAQRAQRATDRLLEADVDRAEILAELENAVVELSSLAIRFTAPCVESASAVNDGRSPALRDRLDALCGEVAAHARRLHERSGGVGSDHAGLWLSRALVLTPPSEAIAAARAAETDRCLRADALLDLRASWLELATSLWLLVQALDDLLLGATFAEPGRLRVAVRSRAGAALVASALHKRPKSFDHEQAWAHQHHWLGVLVGEVCIALQTGEEDVVVRSQQLALRRLSRALAALWSVEERLRPSAREAKPPCP